MEKKLTIIFIVLALAGVSKSLDLPEQRIKEVQADWLLQDEKRLSKIAIGKSVKPEEDAIGAVDGVIDGKWGFHTEYEQNPWWQVDLQKTVPVGKIIIYNRSDLAERNSRITVYLSIDGVNFEQVYQHNNKVFYGFKDGCPLIVELNGKQARYVKLSIPGQNYFHLDEVEVYPQNSNENVALRKPATQSSISQWSTRKSITGNTAKKHPIELTIERGLKLADHLSKSGINVDTQIAELLAIREVARQAEKYRPQDSNQELYFRARWLIRKLALMNPLLNFNQLLFIKRAPTMFPHMSDQHYGWWSRPGGGIFVLEGFKSDQPVARCLTKEFPPGNFYGLDLSYDGSKVLFAYCRFYPQVHKERNKTDKSRLPEDAFYHIYEMNTDGSGVRKLTNGKYDDFDARYLPDGRIIFLSTRKGQTLRITPEYAESTSYADHPDSYVRCGGDNWRPVPVFTLHSMDADGKNIIPISAFENFEWTPYLANDGRILYTRWDYIDRFNGHFFSLWSANQDGTQPQLVYGNYTVRPQVVVEARPIPNSSKLIFTASAHHSITGGSLCLLDRSRGTEGNEPITRLTPEVCFPETEGDPEHYYANPYPLSEEFFIVSWSHSRLPPHTFTTNFNNNPPNSMGIYLYDAFGNQELLYRDPEISCTHPTPIIKRTKPPIHNSTVSLHNKEGRFIVQDVYNGLDGIPRGTIQALRIIGFTPKVQPFMNNPVLGVSAEDPGKFVLGTVPVHADGSAYFIAPAGIPLMFQALDTNGLAVQTMRSITYLMPGQTLSCIGCHESRETAPPVRKLLATASEPSKIKPGPEGSWPLSFDRLVKPVLNRYCVECHNPGNKNSEAVKLDLSSDNAWQNLVNAHNGDIKRLAFEKDRSIPGQCVAANSILWKKLTAEKPHGNKKLDSESLERLATWLDTYAQKSGHFSPEQEQQLIKLRSELATLLH